MVKLQIVTLDERFDQLLAALQGLGYLHLEPAALDSPEAAGELHRMQTSPEDERRRQTLGEAERALRELHAALGEASPRDAIAADHSPAMTPEAIRDVAEEMLRKVRSLRRRRRNFEQDRRLLQRYLRVGHMLPKHGDADGTTVLLFTFPAEERTVAGTLQSRLRALGAPSLRLRFYRERAGHAVAAVVCPADRADEVREAAWRVGTLEFKRPSDCRAEHLAEGFRRVQADVDGLPERIAALDAQLARFARQAQRYSAALERHCEEELQRLDAKRNFLEGSLLRVVHAFLPVDKRVEVVQTAAAVTGDQVDVAELPMGPRVEDVPVVLRNPAFARPFEALLRVFPPPTYGTLDPTVVNAVGVPFFFGLIVGDVAYGAIILAVALWLRRRWRGSSMRSAAATIAAYCGAAAVGFGFLYGELFGSLGLALGLAPWLDREDPRQLLLLLKIAVCVGAAHVALGLALGMLNARRVLDRHALRERCGQLLCVVGAVLLAVGVSVGGAAWFAAAAASLAAAVGMLLWGAGVVGLLEVFSLFSNILSYSRLMALGVASVVLAMVANRIFAQLNYGLTGLLAAASLHGLNLLIALFSPTIHTLRLHYVEFFSKFYRPEGKAYAPFGLRPEGFG